MGGVQGSFGAAWLAHIMERLSARRSLFHSEADFQHALAWQIQTELPSAAVRLETRPFADRRMYLDIAVKLRHHRVAIELKHLTRGLSVEIDGEAFNLANQPAHDIARHDVVNDVARVEQLVRAGLADSGFAIVLTNDSAHWRPGSTATAADAAFRLHEGNELAGTLAWGPTAGAGTTEGRDAPITLAGRYIARWTDYSIVADGNAGQFRYLVIEAHGDAAPGTAEPMSMPSADARQREEPADVGTEQTARAQILKAITTLEQRHDRSAFKMRDIVDEVQQRGSQLAVATIRTFISSVMCLDAPPNHPTRYPDLRRVKRGMYERIKPATVTVPAAVREVVDAWRDAGRPRQMSSTWPKAAWIETFPDQQDFLAGLPDRLARSHVRAACVSAGRNEAAARQALLAVMAWGYGSVGYGRWRTQEIIRNNASGPSDLAAAANAVASDGAVAGYRALAGEHRLDGLGPSFGTKFLYFCSQHDEQRPALILDRLMGEWLDTHVDLRVDTGQWSVRSYARYVEHMWQWAAAIGEPADVLEECILTEQSRQAGNQWA